MKKNFPAYHALMDEGPFPSNQRIGDQLFKRAIVESFNHHYQHCAAFSNYCDNRSIMPNLIDMDLLDLPYIPVQAFKTFGKDLLTTITNEKKSFFMNSSATSGQPSSINVSRNTAKRQALSMAQVVASFLGTRKRPFIIFDVKPSSEGLGVIGARYGATVGYMSFSSEAHFVLKKGKLGTIEIDQKALDNAIKAIILSGEPPVIFGFTFVIFETLRSLDDKIKLANFDAGSILHIGGWKKLETQKVSKSIFNKMVANSFGLRPKDVIDAYGFTEQMGVNYFSSGLNDKVAPNFSRVLVRDPATLKLLSPGNEGLLQFISPLPLSYPGISVLTDDIGIVTHEYGEVDGRHGTIFRVTGRAKNAEVRGCGDIMSSYLERKKHQNISTNLLKFEPRLLFLKKSHVDNDDMDGVIKFNTLPKINEIKEIKKSLELNLKKLSCYSIDDLITFFAITSQSWLSSQSPMRHLQKHGLSFLVKWLQADNLRAMTNKSLKGNRVALDRFVPDSEFPVRLLRCAPRGIVGHWLAGNVPLLGMLGLVQGILTKNANIIRVAASNSAVMPIILDVISKSKITLPNGVTVIGSDITDTIAVLYYDKNDLDFANSMSNICDARIAWGGAEAVHSVSKLSIKIDCQTVIYGPKLSYSAISSEMLSEGQNVEKLLRRLATDCSVFDQYACASPHTIFIEKSDFLNPIEFCERFAQHMEKAAARIPKDNIDAGTAAQIVAKRFEYDFKSKIWQSNGTTWTIVLEEEKVELVAPTYSRFVTVIFVDDILEAAELANPDVQTISLAMPYHTKLKFSEIALRKGAIRFPDVGRMTHFEAPWDGIFLMDRLVRFVTMGGPAV